MKIRYVYAICVWKPNARWPDQLDLKLVKMGTDEFLDEVWRHRSKLVATDDCQELTVVVDLMQDDGPRIIGVYGWIPYKYIDEVMILERQVLAVKDKLVSYVIKSSLSEALKPE